MINSEPPSFSIISEANDFRISWQSGYPLYILAEPPIYRDLGIQRQFVAFQKLHDQTNIAIFSEQSSGRKSFIQAYLDFLNAQNKPWLVAQSLSWDQDSFLISKPCANLPALVDFKLAVSEFGNKKGVGNKIKIIKNWLEAHPQQAITLIIENLAGFAGKDKNHKDKENAEDILFALRQLYDNKGHDLVNFQIILTDSSDRFYQEQPDFSSYMPLCHQYRLPYLIKHEITHLASSYSIQLSDDSTERVLDHTGGHPLLLRECLIRLQANSDTKAPNFRQIDQIARQMRASPPAVTKLWQQELTTVLEENNDLLNAIRAYVSGDTLGEWRFPPPAQERPLFVTGWLSLDRLDRWGITSTLHAELARVVLDKFK